MIRLKENNWTSICQKFKELISYFKRFQKLLRNRLKVQYKIDKRYGMKPKKNKYKRLNLGKDFNYASKQINAN